MSAKQSMLLNNIDLRRGIKKIIGLGGLWLFKIVLPFENWILSFLTIPITMSWNFFLSYRILPKY